MGQHAQQFDDDRLRVLPAGTLKRANALQQVIPIGGRSFGLTDCRLTQEPIDLSIVEYAAEFVEDLFQRTVLVHLQW